MTAVTLTSGGHHDLVAVMEALEDRYFGQSLGVTIGWARKVRPIRTLGWYIWEDRHIAIAGRLNTRRVPRYVIGHVVYHELCHAVRGVSSTGHAHDEVFAALEARYRYHARALYWLAHHYPQVEL